MAALSVLDELSPNKRAQIERILALMDEYLVFLVPLFSELSMPQQNQARHQLRLFLAQQDGANLRLLTVFLHLMNFWCLVSRRRRFRSLTQVQKDRLIQQFFASPIGLVRKGFWGINTLAKLAVFSQDCVHPLINYHPRPTPKGIS